MLVVSYSLQDNYFQSLVLIFLAAPAGAAGKKKKSWTCVPEWVFKSRQLTGGGTTLRIQDPVPGAIKVPGKSAVRKPGTDPANA